MAYRYVHPTAMTVGLVALGMIAGADGSWARPVVLFLGLSMMYLLSRPTVVLARTRSGIVALRPTLLRPSRPSTHVADRFDAATPVALGPAAFYYRPLTVSYRRYWVHWTHSASAEQLAGPSDDHINTP